MSILQNWTLEALDAELERWVNRVLEPRWCAMSAPTRARNQLLQCNECGPFKRVGTPSHLRPPFIKGL
jgi:hypothetical protein